MAEIEQLRRRFLEAGADLDPVDAEALIDRVQKGEVVAIDVRPIEEYKTAHIPGALAMPLQELKRRLSELPRNKEIVAYCRGPYCVLAHRLEASVQDWRARGLPVAIGLEQGSIKALQRRAR